MRKPMIKILAVALGVVFAGAAGAAEGEKVKWSVHSGEIDEAIALDGDKVNGRDVFEVCSACHLPEGWGTEDGTFPQLAGQHADVLIKQLSDIRAKNRDNPTMYPFALPESIGDAQALADVVAYIETIPMNPKPGYGPWEPGTPEYEKGAQLYKDNCTR
ncbi:c-type cytochrome, partial [Thioalbus denitrificans]